MIFSRVAAMQRPDGKRQPVSLTVADLEGLDRDIGR